MQQGLWGSLFVQVPLKITFVYEMFNKGNKILFTYPSSIS